MIWIAQLLCPSRHAIMGMPYEGDSVEVTALGEKLFASGALRRRCGICGSKDLVWEFRASAFKTLEAATRAMQECHFDQMLTRAYLDSKGLTADSKEKHGPGTKEDREPHT